MKMCAWVADPLPRADNLIHVWEDDIEGTVRGQPKTAFVIAFASRLEAKSLHRKGHVVAWCATRVDAGFNGGRNMVRFDADGVKRCTCGGGVPLVALHAIAVLFLYALDKIAFPVHAARGSGAESCIASNPWYCTTMLMPSL
jgi:hypothetical protein